MKGRLRSVGTMPSDHTGETRRRVRHPPTSGSMLREAHFKGTRGLILSLPPFPSPSASFARSDASERGRERLKRHSGSDPAGFLTVFQALLQGSFRPWDHATTVQQRQKAIENKGLEIAAPSLRPGGACHSRECPASNGFRRSQRQRFGGRSQRTQQTPSLVYL